MSYVNAVDSTDRPIRLVPIGLPGGTPQNGGSAPRMTLVLESDTGDYLGHLELSPLNAQTLGEEIRKAAEAAQTTLEEE